MKVCKECSESKEFSEFSKHSGMRDGYLNYCKECIKARNYRKNNIDHYRNYDNNRSRDKRRIELGTHTTKQYREKYPERYRATNKVNNALRDGKISRYPCFICGSENVVAHHADYSRPLDVIWLCQIHHKETHALID